MGEKRMLIIITRMYANQGDTLLDEFVEQNFFNQQNPNQLHAVFPQIPNNQTERIVVVIHGYNGRFNNPNIERDKATSSIAQTIKNVISSISINLQEFTIGILFHPHHEWQNFSDYFQGKINNELNNQLNQNITIKFVEQYSSSVPQGEYKKVQELAQAVRNSDFSQKFDEVWKHFLNKPPRKMSESAQHLSILKHKILNLLTPLQIDIEGLIEKNFDENYWEQVAKAHKNLSQEFQNVKNLIYKSTSTSGKSEAETIEDIISKITDEETKKYLENLLDKIEKLLPKDSQDPDKLTGDKTVNSLLEALKNKQINEFKRIITLHGNVYKKWMDELIGAIEQIILELQTKE